MPEHTIPNRLIRVTVATKLLTARTFRYSNKNHTHQHSCILIQHYAILTLVTMRSHPTRPTVAVTIISPALRRMLAFARLAAVRPIVIVRTRLIACRTRETGHTLTLPGHMIALGAVLALALERTIRPVRRRRTRMLTRQPNVAWPANILPGDVIARRAVVPRFGALLFAAQTKRSARARFRTVRSGPTARANALAVLRIARRIVQARAQIFAALAVAADRTLGAAIDA